MATVRAPKQRQAHSASAEYQLPHAPREVRIIGGAWKRSKLPVIAAAGLRPTPDRVRETLFNWLGQDLSGWRCLDAFAGTGALGFEAASRGATRVVMLEQDPRVMLNLLSLQTKFKSKALHLERAEALSWMQHQEPHMFDLIFIDPPFGAQLFELALQYAAPLLAPQGLIYLEADRQFDAVKLAPLGYAVHKCAKAGAVHYHLIKPLGEKSVDEYQPPRD